MSNMVLVSVFDHAVGEYAPCMCVNSRLLLFGFLLTR